MTKLCSREFWNIMFKYPFVFIYHHVWVLFEYIYVIYLESKRFDSGYNYILLNHSMCKSIQKFFFIINLFVHSNDLILVLII